MVRYEDCIAHIVLKTTEEAEKAIVSKTVGIWQSEFERSMSDIKGYVIYHYQTKRSTGFIAPVLGLKRSLINKEVNSMKVPEKLVLLGISSGLIELTKC